MMRLRRLAKKDRYGVVRGTMLLGFVMLLCTVMVIALFFSYDIVAEEERVFDAAMRVAAQFDQHIGGAFEQLECQADLIRNNVSEKNVLLESIENNSIFDRAALLRGNDLCYSDGSVETPSWENAGSDENSIVQDGGKICLTVPVSEQETLVAWLDNNSIKSILNDVYANDYGFAVYSNATGAYILKNDFIAEENHFDYLRSINKNGAMESLLKNESVPEYVKAGGASKNYYIAQKNTMEPELSISVRIPSEIVKSASFSKKILPYATVLAAALMLTILISYTIYSLRLVHLSNRNIAQAIHAGDHMLSILSKDATVTTFVFKRGSEQLTSFYDGLDLLENQNSARIQSLSSLINGCDIADEEHEKLRDVLGKVQAGESREVLIHTSHSDRERRVLRFVMHGMDDDQSVICCVSDCTQAQASMDRVEIEQNFMESVRAKTTSIWQINVTKNRWALLHSKKSDPLSSLKIEKNSWRDYEADLVGCIRDHLNPADYEAYAKSMSLASLAYDFRSGNYELNRDYRVHSKSTAEYAWHRTCIRIWMNPYSKDIIANMYVFNVDAEKNAELERGERKRILNETLRALGGIYYGLYYVDLEKDLCYAAKPLGGELVSQLCAPYKQTFDGYIENSVHPDDREALREMLSAYALRRGMKEGSHFKRMAYKRKVGDGFENAQIIIQPARFENGDVKEVVLAIRYLKQKSE